MPTTSPYRILFTPRGGGPAIVLCEFGQEMEQLIQWDDCTQQIVEAEGAASNEVFFKPVGSAAMNLSFAVRTTHANHLLACDKFAEGLSGEPLLRGDGTLEVQFPGMIYGFELAYGFEQAAIDGMQKAMPNDGSGESVVVVNYQVKAAMDTQGVAPSEFYHGLGSRAASTIPRW